MIAEESKKTAASLPDLETDARIEERERWAELLVGLVEAGICSASELASGDMQSESYKHLLRTYRWGVAFSRLKKTLPAKASAGIVSFKGL